MAGFMLHASCLHLKLQSQAAR